MYLGSIGSACLNNLCELDFGADEIFWPLRQDAGVVFCDVLCGLLEKEDM